MLVDRDTGTGSVAPVTTDPWGNPDPRPEPGGPVPAANVPPLGWAPPGHGPAPSPWTQPAKPDNLATASMVTGIVSMVCCGIVGAALGAAALGMGVTSMRRIGASQGSLSGRGQAVAGVVLGALGFVVGLSFFVYFTFVNPDFIPELLEDLSPTTTAGGAR